MASDRFEREKAVMDQLKKATHVLEGLSLVHIGMDLDGLSEVQLSGIEGFIIYCNRENMRPGYIASNILHDLGGIGEDDETFSPRTRSYAKYKDVA